MIERNRKESEEKVSRGFFYKNQQYGTRWTELLNSRPGLSIQEKKIIDHAMENQISLLEQQVASLKVENGLLKKENQKLKKALNKRKLNFIKTL